MSSNGKERTPAQQVQDYIDGYAWGGTESYHRGALPFLMFTDGVLHVAETCQAYWLVDAIASHQPAIHKKHGPQGFQLWILEQSVGQDPKDHWRLEAWTDTPLRHDVDAMPPGRLLAKQRIPYSDFPKELSPFRLWVEGDVLLLPAEH